MKKINTIRLAIAIMLLFTTAFFVDSAKANDFFDSKGTDHWLTFIPNFHNNISENRDELRNGDSLYIFIGCDVPTRGVIEYKDFEGNSYSQDYEITDPNKIFTFRVSWNKFELQGFNRSSTTWSRFQCEEIAPQSFHVTSENEVMVYAHSQSVMTSDAFLVLPTDVLGQDYFVLAYKSDVSLGGISNTPSQFAVVASEDDTEVRINPSTATYINGTREQNITLNKGEAYLVQADAEGNFGYADLTGTKLVSSKPIALFAGHQRASIPAGELGGSPSRDILIEQMLPVKNWGKNAFIVPFRQESNQTTDGDDIYRVLAAYDETSVTINDGNTIVINEGDFFEYPIIGPAKIKANKPILVAQYKKTAGNGGSNRGTGDPMMMLIPPKEQFMNNYRVINTQANEAYSDGFNRISHREVYDKQYINIVCPTDKINTVRIDDNPVNPAAFSGIPTSDYSFAAVQVTDGVHSVEADAPFGIYIYGYGDANSYGYTGGLSFKPYDFLPPAINFVEECFKVNGIISDSTMNDTGIIEAYAPENSIENVDLVINQFTQYQKIIPFTAELINWKLDGKFSLVVRDSMEFTTSLEMRIPGFTVAVKDVRESDETSIISKDLHIDEQYCFDIVLENYGSFEQKLINLEYNISEFSTNFNGPIFLQPGKTKTITVCFSSDVEGDFIDSLMIVGECNKRKAADVILKVKKDDNNPKLHKNVDPCNTTINLTITDSTSFDYGIESIEFTDKHNCNIRNLEQNTRLYSFEVKVIDVYQDAYYTLVAIDKAGNSSTYYDTIPGFTLTISNPDIDTNMVDFGDNIIGSLICKPIEISNYGDLPHTIYNIQLAIKSDYSIPESQFPATIAPGETKYFDICFHPTEAFDGFISDTAKLIINCAERNIPLMGVSEPKISDAISRCDVPLKLLTKKVPRSYFLEIYPNPVIEGGIIRAGIPNKGEYALLIQNVFGNIVKSITTVNLNGGIFEFEFTTSDIPAGTYILTIKSDRSSVSEQFIIVK